MYQITVSEEIKNACPIFKGAAVYAEVTNTAFCEGLWEEINTFTRELTSTTQPEDIKLLPSFCRSLAPPSDARNCPLPNRYIG